MFSKRVKPEDFPERVKIKDQYDTAVKSAKAAVIEAEEPTPTELHQQWQREQKGLPPIAEDVLKEANRLGVKSGSTERHYNAKIELAKLQHQRRDYVEAAKNAHSKAYKANKWRGFEGFSLSFTDAVTGQQFLLRANEVTSVSRGEVPSGQIMTKSRNGFVNEDLMLNATAIETESWCSGKAEKRTYFVANPVFDTRMRVAVAQLPCRIIG